MAVQIEDVEGVAAASDVGGCKIRAVHILNVEDIIRRRPAGTTKTNGFEGHVVKDWEGKTLFGFDDPPHTLWGK